MMTAESMAEAAASWFGSLGHWPEETVAQVAVQNYRAKLEGESYYGVAAVLLMLVAVNGGEWPPMSPKRFAAGLTEPRTVAQIGRYAKNIAAVESRKEMKG